jgi:hypothetical protein
MLYYDPNKYSINLPTSRWKPHIQHSLSSMYWFQSMPPTGTFSNKCATLNAFLLFQFTRRRTDGSTYRMDVRKTARVVVGIVSTVVPIYIPKMHFEKKNLSQKFKKNWNIKHNSSFLPHLVLQNRYYYSAPVLLLYCFTTYLLCFFSVLSCVIELFCILFELLCWLCNWHLCC